MIWKNIFFFKDVDYSNTTWSRNEKPGKTLFGEKLKLIILQGWEFAHRFSERIARFL